MTQNILDRTEQARSAAQVALDARKSAQERNQLGQFSTPTRLALQLAELASERLAARCPVRFMDPGVGTGVFFYAACKVFGNRITSAWGYETDTEVAKTAQQLWGPLGLDVRPEDFCTALPPCDDTQKANLVICNPPYVRHHHLAAAQKSWLQTEVQRAGYGINGLAGLYSYFLILAHRWLSRDGVGVWLIPAECLDVNYGKAIKEYLTADVTLLRLHRFDPHDVQFTDALVSSVVVQFQMGKPSSRSQVQISTGGSLSVPQHVRMMPLGYLAPAAKWGPLFTGAQARGSQVADSLTIGDLFKVKRGLATGANDFFILKRRHADDLGLPRKYLRPILPSPREIPGSVIEANGEGFPREIPQLVLLDCNLPLDEIQKHAPALFVYLKSGERQGIPGRYLPAHRRPWYSQEVRPPAPILCTYMGRQNGGRALRFLRNKSAATAPNVYLLLYPKPRLAAQLQVDPSLIESVFQALTEAAATLAEGGRVYGGGLNKIEPKELEAIHLPVSLEQKCPRLTEFQLSAQ